MTPIWCPNSPQKPSVTSDESHYPLSRAFFECGHARPSAGASGQDLRRSQAHWLSEPQRGVAGPAAIDGESARRTLGFTGPTVLFPGTPRSHKGLEPLAQAVARVPGARLAVPCRSNDLAGPEWGHFPLDRIPMTSYCSFPIMLAAGDVVAISRP